MSGSSAGEGLFAAGTVRLFGRPFAGLAVGDLSLPTGSNNQLAASIRDAASRNMPPSLARIYGFSYLGNYYKLAEPAVFLVFTDGEPVPSGSSTPDAPVGLVGVELKGEAFADGVRVWTIDQLDVAVRIDIKIGWIKDLLLSEMAGDNNITGGDAVRRADLVGRDGNLVGRDGNLIGRSR